MVCAHGRWRSYFTSGSSAAYLFLYSLFYFYTKLDINKWVPMVMYFGYMAIVSISFFCLTGESSALLPSTCQSCPAAGLWHQGSEQRIMRSCPLAAGYRDHTASDK